MSRLSAMAREQSTNYKHYYREKLRMVYNIRIDNNKFERLNRISAIRCFKIAISAEIV